VHNELTTLVRSPHCCRMQSCCPQFLNFVAPLLAAKREYYIQLEEVVHNELVNLAADAQQTLGLVAHALHIQARALMSSGDQLRERETLVRLCFGHALI